MNFPGMNPKAPAADAPPEPESESATAPTEASAPVADEPHPDEVAPVPAFVIEANNPIILRVIRHYISEASAAGLSDEHIQAVAARRKIIAEWQRTHGTVYL